MFSCVWLFVTPWTAACQPSLSSTIFVQTHVHWVSDTIHLFHHLSPPSPLANLSHHQGFFQWVSSLHQVGKILELQLQHPVNIQDWFPLGLTGLIFLQTKRLSSLQHHSSKASILWCSAFFMIQFSHPYMTTGKIIALTTWTFVSKVISLIFNTLCRFVTVFLPSILKFWLRILIKFYRTVWILVYKQTMKLN